MKLTTQLRLALLMLLAVSGTCFSAPISTQSRDACLREAELSPELREADESGGRMGVQEYFIDRCGARETGRNNEGKRFLSKSDCNELYDWASSGACNENDFSNRQYMIVKELDPKVFQLSRFKAACKNVQLDKMSKDVFRASVCTEQDASKQSKKMKDE